MDPLDLYSLSLVTDTDDKGVPWEWQNICCLLNHRGAGAINDLFDYYLEHNKNFDPWTNYLITLSHFSEGDFEVPKNWVRRAKLEERVRKIIEEESQSGYAVKEEFMI